MVLGSGAAWEAAVASVMESLTSASKGEKAKLPSRQAKRRVYWCPAKSEPPNANSVGRGTAAPLAGWGLPQDTGTGEWYSPSGCLGPLPGCLSQPPPIKAQTPPKRSPGHQTPRSQQLHQNMAKAATSILVFPGSSKATRRQTRSGRKKGSLVNKSGSPASNENLKAQTKAWSLLSNRLVLWQ